MEQALRGQSRSQEAIARCSELLVAKRVIVVGAGIVGVACAASLLKDGHDVVLIDREGPAAGASQGNAGAISPGSCVPLAMPGVLKKVPSWLFDPEGPLVVRPGYVAKALPWLLRFVDSARPARVANAADALRALHQHVFEFYAPLVQGAGCSELLKRSGTLNLYSSAEALERSRSEWEMRSARGAEVQFVYGPEIRQLQPGISEAYHHAVFLPEHGYVADPKELVNRLARAFEDSGGHLLRESVDSIATNAGRPVITLGSGSIVDADEVVIAAGAWSGALLTKAGVRLPLESQRGYQVTLQECSVSPRLPMTLSDEKVYVTPMREGVRIAGTVEFAGLKAEPNWPRARRLLKILGKVYPHATYSRFTEWMGHRPTFPDSLPVIGRISKLPGVIAAFGHGHNGMTGGPITGQIIADLVAGRDPPIDISPFRPDRFA
jgi:D-amino-acid dehydrogenase